MHDRIMARIKLCADRARTMADKKKTYKEIPYAIPKSIAELQYLICYHKMTTDDLLVFATFLPKIVTHMDRIVKTQIMDLAEQYWSE